MLSVSIKGFAQNLIRTFFSLSIAFMFIAPFMLALAYFSQFLNGATGWQVMTFFFASLVFALVVSIGLIFVSQKWFKVLDRI